MSSQRSVIQSDIDDQVQAAPWKYTLLHSSEQPTVPRRLRRPSQVPQSASSRKDSSLRAPGAGPDWSLFSRSLSADLAGLQLQQALRNAPASLTQALHKLRSVGSEAALLRAN